MNNNIEIAIDVRTNTEVIFENINTVKGCCSRSRHCINGMTNELITSTLCGGYIVNEKYWYNNKDFNTYFIRETCKCIYGTFKWAALYCVKGLLVNRKSYSQRVFLLRNNDKFQLYKYENGICLLLELSDADIYATDWEVYPINDINKHIIWAIAKMSQGYKVKSPNWSDNSYLSVDDNHEICMYRNKNGVEEYYSLSSCDILSTNWEISDTDEFNLKWAYDKATDGFKVRRRGWINKEYILNCKDDRLFKKIKNGIDCGIHITYIDMISKDWEIVLDCKNRDPVKEESKCDATVEVHDFIWAINQLKNGKRIKRLNDIRNIDNNYYVQLSKDNNNFITPDCDGPIIGLHTKDIFATDWITVEDNSDIKGTFDWAMKKYNEGCIISKKSWNKGNILVIIDNKPYMKDANNKNYYCLEDTVLLKDTDWIVCDGGGKFEYKILY